ncbi:MAG: hypothetical protein QOJ65_2378 [Fimbriimonadaceae bacterium]|jgi:hypothetical protein|nr:hypothetical protein [Fimbriimonadaceae bacterium]
MIVYGGRAKRWKGGCFILPIVLFLVVTGSLSNVLPLVFMAMAIFFVISVVNQQRRGTVVREQEPERQRVKVPGPPPPMRLSEIDQRIRSIRSLQQTINQALEQHQGHPVVQVTAGDIREEASRLVAEAEQIHLSHGRLSRSIAECRVTNRELRELTEEVERETDARVKATLEATLERKTAEKENLRRMTDTGRYLEALLEQAEATLSELRSRIALSVVETEDYTNPRSRLELTEANEQLKSVSEAMRQTLGDIS